MLCGLGSLIALGLPDSHTQQLLLEFDALAYVSVVLNLVPLLELDGYWFMADALDRPGLHHDAVAGLRRALRREPIDRPLAVYAALSSVFGILSLVAGVAIWWHLFGDLFHQLWNGGVAYKLLAVYLILPFIVLALQLASQAVARLHSHTRTHTSEPTVQPHPAEVDGTSAAARDADSENHGSDRPVGAARSQGSLQGFRDPRGGR